MYLCIELIVYYIVDMTIAVDFDGTIVEHRYPEIGKERPFAIQTLKMLIQDRHKLILWSVREGGLLDEAVEWCRKRGVEFYAVNKDFPEEDFSRNKHFSRKLKEVFKVSVFQSRSFKFCTIVFLKEMRCSDYCSIRTGFTELRNFIVK